MKKSGSVYEDFSMSVFTSRSFMGHEQVVFGHDAETGLKTIIAVHNTTLGPAVGGCRFWPYAGEQEALEDALRLSRGMTYKAAMANLDFGGGKAVIIGDPKVDKTPALLTAFARQVDHLAGRYVTAEDVGTGPADMEIIRRTTDYVAGTSAGGSGDGDPSPATAWGVFNGIRATSFYGCKRDSLKGVRIALQGLGNVGQYVMRYLAAAGAQLTVTDIDDSRMAKAASEFGAELVAPGKIYDVEAEIFVPNALGAILNDDTIPRLKVKAVAGSANNQLAEDRHGDMLRARGILYAPDYVINAGGIINIRHEGPDYDRETAFADCAKIYDTLMDVFRRSDLDDAATNVVADRMAQERIDAKRRNHAEAA
jgi:leucine dehydrogenase